MYQTMSYEDQLHMKETQIRELLEEALIQGGQIDENGNAVFVYHARSEECYKNQCQWSSASSLYDPCRHARVKRVHWAADGTPILNMSYEEELNDAYKNVTVQVTVEDNSGEEELAIIENPKNYVGKIGETAEFTVKSNRRRSDL